MLTMASKKELKESMSIAVLRGYKRLVRIVAADKKFDDSSEYVRSLIERDIAQTLPADYIQRVIDEENPPIARIIGTREPDPDPDEQESPPTERPVPKVNRAGR